MQIVHDLKNQLNGLKLYATFLRRRIEKDPADPKIILTVWGSGYKCADV